MAKDCGSVDIQPILRKLDAIQQEQREQRKAIQLLGKGLFSGEGSSDSGYQNVVDLDVRGLLGIPDKVRADLANQNATLQMIRRDVWAVSNRVQALETKTLRAIDRTESVIISRIAEFIRTYFGQIRSNVENIRNMTVTIGNRTADIRKFCNDILYGVNEANRKLNALGNIGDLRKLINDILFGTNRANIKLDNLISTVQGINGTIKLLGTAIAALQIAVINTVKGEINTATLTLNANMNGIPGRVINALSPLINQVITTVRGEHNTTRALIANGVSQTSALVNSVNTNLSNLIRGLPTVGMIDALIQRVNTQLSSVMQQNTRLIVDRIISLPIPEMQKDVKKVLEILTSDTKKLDDILKAIRDFTTANGRRITRIYNILGGNRWFKGDNDSPELTFNPEGDIKFYGSRMFNQDGTSKELTVGSLADFASSLIAANFYRSGLHRLPAKVPAKIHLKNGEQDNEQNISTALDFSLWQFRQLDSALGMYPLRIKYKDAQGQEKWLEIDNIAEGMSEIVGMLVSLDSDTDIITEAQFKTIGESIQTKAAISLVNDYVVAISDFLGFKYDIGERKMPIPVNPKATNLKDFMVKSEQSIQKVEIREPDTNDVITKLNQLLIATGVIKAALSRKADQGGLPGDYIKTEIDKVDSDWNEFKSFINNYPTSLRQPGQPKPHIDDRTVLIADEVNNNQP